jgi:iron complex outermembrane receptor protein
MKDQIRCTLAVLAALCATAPSHGQATANAITAADDAFGTNDGGESVGIYNESTVRGFSLEAAGNYRVNGRYFVKSSGVSSVFVERSLVRIGYNTLNLDFPGPSGVVDYQLRDPGPEAPNLVTIGLDVYEQPYVELLLQHRSESGSFSGALGLMVSSDRGDEQGGRGEDGLVAGVARWSPAEGFSLQAFGGEYTYRRQGKFGIFLAPEGESLPDPIARRRYIGQDWAEEQGQRRIAGLLSDIELGGGWRGAASAVFSQEDPSRAFSQLFYADAEVERALSRIIASPAQSLTAYSGEASFGWRGRQFGALNDVTMHLRLRESRGRRGGEILAEAGETDLGSAAAAISRPALGGVEAPLRDRIDQIGVGLSWQGRTERLRWNLGVLRSDYEKTFADAGGQTSATAIEPWLYNAAVAYALRPGLDLYGSYSRGIEEAGIAPASAANPNEVLDAGISTQRELGMRLSLDNGLALVVAGFDTEKPLPAIDPSDDVFRLIGDVRHRGVEFSLSGEVNEHLSIVAGGVYTSADVTSPAVAAGEAGSRPVAVPDLRLIASANYVMPGLPGLSFDAGLEYAGKQAARSALSSDGTQLEIPAYAVLDLGARYSFGETGRNWTVRGQIRNVTDRFRWQVSRAEALTYIAPRSFRLVTTRAF